MKVMGRGRNWLKDMFSADVPRASPWKDTIHLHCKEEVSDNECMHMCKEMRRAEGGLKWPGLAAFGKG